MVHKCWSAGGRGSCDESLGIELLEQRRASYERYIGEVYRIWRVDMVDAVEFRCKLNAQLRQLLANGSVDGTDREVAATTRGERLLGACSFSLGVPGTLLVPYARALAAEGDRKQASTHVHKAASKQAVRYQLQ